MSAAQDSLRVWSIEVVKAGSGKLSVFVTPGCARPIPLLTHAMALRTRVFDKEDAVYCYADFEASSGLLRALARQFCKGADDKNRVAALRRQVF